VLIILAILLLFASAAGGLASDDVKDRVQYDVSAEKVFIGEVHDKANLFEGRMYFTLWTHSGVFAVEMGPKEFVEKSGFRLQRGQIVTVVGMPVVIGNREMVIAREITRTGAVFVARDRNGHPLWEKNRPVQMDPEVGNSGIPACEEL
jgi:hypothetical protein